MRATPLLRLSPDDALARRAVRGDDDAFAALYDRYRLPLEAYCRGIVRHEEDARDAAQSALAAAYQALRRGTRPQTVRPWLFRIAHNEAISVLRRRRVVAQLPAELPARLAGPGDALELREELTAVLAAVRALAPGSRSALLLRELGDLSYAQIAEVLGTTPAGARQSVFEARVALQADRAGRGSDCDAIRSELSAHDGRRRQARHIRGHLRGCDACRDWSRAERQRRQRLAIGGVPLPFAGWLAAVFGGAAGAGGGASLAGGLTVQTQLAAATIALVAGAAPVVAPDGAPDTQGGKDPAPAATGAAALTTSAGPARLTAATGAPARTRPAAMVRAAARQPGAAEDGGGVEGRRPGTVEDAASLPEERPGPRRRFSADRRPRDDDAAGWRRDRWDGHHDGRRERRDRWPDDDGPADRRPAREDQPPAEEASRPARSPHAQPPPVQEHEDDAAPDDGPAPAPAPEPAAPAEPEPQAAPTTPAETTASAPEQE